MLDINLIRDKSDLVKQNQLKAGKKASDVDDVLKIDKKWRESKLELDRLRAKRNKISEDINQAKKTKEEKKAKELIRQAKSLPEEIKSLEEKESELKKQLDLLISSMPNIISKQTPIGKDSSENKEIKHWGKPKKFNFPIKNHVEIAESLNIANFDESAKVSGNGFYYLKNELAYLNQALIRFAIDFMKSKGYEYIETPLMLNEKSIFASMDKKAIEETIGEMVAKFGR